MKVFIVGATGYLGSVLVEHLIGAQHAVIALSRSDAGDAKLRGLGATPLRGSLVDEEVLTAAAVEADAVVYAASDYAATEASMQVELAAVGALVTGAARSGRAGAASGTGAATRTGAAVDSRAVTGKPVIYTSTGLVYGPNATDTDEDAVLPETSAQPVKAAAERIVFDAPGIIGMSIRAGLIFGRGGTVLLTGLIAAAQAHGAATYIDDGANTWMPVHVDDLADLYVRALEHPVAGAYNAVGSVPFTFRQLAEAIGELTGSPAVSIPFSVAEQSMGAGAATLTSTSHLSAAKARATFGWQPTARSLTDDVRRGSYAATDAG